MRPSTTLVVQKILGIVVGIVAVAWPGITVGAFVVLFGVYAFLAALMQAARAFRSDGAGAVVGHLLLAVIDAAAGVAALVWPGITAVALVWLVAAWALGIGVVEIVLAFAAGETAGERALFGLTGLVSIALGVVLVARPDAGAVALAQVYGLFSLVAGISQLVLAANLPQSRPVEAVPLATPA